MLRVGSDSVAVLFLWAVHAITNTDEPVPLERRRRRTDESNSQRASPSSELRAMLKCH